MKRFKQIIFKLIGVVLVISGCTPASDAAKAEVPEGAQAGEMTEWIPCEFTPMGSKNSYAAECATLTVPENWQKPDSRLIALPVVRFVSTSTKPAEPVFILHGGPGIPNLLGKPEDWLMEQHDVILMGYRGLEGSVELVCPGVSDLSAKYFSENFLSDESTASLGDATAQCAQEYINAGVDLDGYTVAGVAEDLEALRMALGYEKINLWGESYGTRVAQIYAYQYPHHLNRMLLIGMNPPGHFLYDPAALDEMIAHLSDLCSQDPDCSARGIDFAQAMYAVNHNMPRRWLFLPIDPGTIRMLTQVMFFNTSNMGMVIEAYQAAANGDPSGLAMLNLVGPFMFPFKLFRLGDFMSKGGSLDLEYYQGSESLNFGNSTMGRPMDEWIWPMISNWPVNLADTELRQIQESDVDMLIVNGTVDFSTPPQALNEVKPYYHNAKTVLLSEFSHVSDVTSLQPEAFKQLATRYYAEGIVDISKFEYQPVSFQPKMSIVRMAKILIAALMFVPLLLVGLVGLIVRMVKRRKATQ